MNNKIGIFRNTKEKTCRRRRTREGDGTWRGMGVRGNDGSRNNSSRTANTANTRAFIFCTPFSVQFLSNILIRLPPFFSVFFRRLLLARRGKKRFLPLHRYYDNARLYVNGGAIYIYQRPRVFIPRINFFFYYLLSSAESRLRLVVFSLSPFRYLRNVYTAARLSSGARDERKVNERPSVIC